MSSKPPPDWQQQVQDGLGEGSEIGPVKSRYLALLEAVYRHSDAHESNFVSVMIDVLEDYCERNHIRVEK